MQKDKAVNAFQRHTPIIHQNYFGSVQMVTSGRQYTAVSKEEDGAQSVVQTNTPLSKCKSLPKNTMGNVYHRSMSIYAPSFYGSVGVDINGKISREESKTVAGVESAAGKIRKTNIGLT